MRRASLPQRRALRGNRRQRRSGLPSCTTPAASGCSRSQPVAGLLVHPQVVGARRAGEQRQPARVRRARPPRRAPAASGPSPRPRRSGATISRPTSHDVAVEPAAHGADQPAAGAYDERGPRRRARRGRRRGPRAAAGCRASSLACASVTQQASCRVEQLAGVRRRRGADLERPRPPTVERRGWGAAGPGGGRPCGARACSWRQAAIRRVVAGEQHRRDVVAAPGGGLGVDGVLQQAGVAVRLLGQRLGVAHEAGQQPDDRLGDHQRGDLAAVEHVVAERHLAHPASGSRRRRAPAGRCPRSGRTRTPAGSAAASSAASAWVNGSPLGVGTTSTVRRRLGRPARRAPRPTARASSPCRRRRRTACRRRCGAGRGSSPAGRARVRRAAPASCALPASESRSGARYSGKIETTSMRTAQSSSGQRGDQAGPVGDLDAARRPRRRPGPARRRTAPAPRGRRRVRTASRSWPAPWITSATSPTGVAVGGDHREPDQLVVVELLGVLGHLGRVDVGDQRRARAAPRRRCGRRARRR